MEHLFIPENLSDFTLTPPEFAKDFDGGFQHQQQEMLEQLLVGSMLIDDKYYNLATAKLATATFVHPQSKVIFELLLSLKKDNKESVDMATVIAKANEHPLFKEEGCFVFIGDLIEEVKSSTINFDDWIKALTKCQVVNEVTSQESIIDTIKHNKDYVGIVKQRCITYNKATFSLIGEVFTPFNTLVQSSVDRLYSSMEHNTSQGIPTFSESLNKMTAGLRTGQMTLIAARPSMGKTAVSIALATGLATQGKGVIFLLLEAKANSVVIRMYAAKTGIDAISIKKGHVTQAELHKLNEAKEFLCDLPVLFDDDSYLTPSILSNKIKEVRKRHKLDAIVLDYLQLMEDDKGMSSTREQAIRNISSSVTGLVKKENIAGIVICQLNRSVENREDKTPVPSDIRGGSQIEKDACLICFLYRPAYYGIANFDDGTSTEGVLELIVGKNRFGQVGRVKLVFDGRTVKDDTQPIDTPTETEWESLDDVLGAIQPTNELVLEEAPF